MEFTKGKDNLSPEIYQHGNHKIFDAGEDVSKKKSMASSFFGGGVCVEAVIRKQRLGSVHLLGSHPFLRAGPSLFATSCSRLACLPDYLSV